jgi:hypothetical protein
LTDKLNQFGLFARRERGVAKLRTWLVRATFADGTITRWPITRWTAIAITGRSVGTWPITFAGRPFGSWTVALATNFSLGSWTITVTTNFPFTGAVSIAANFPFPFGFALSLRSALLSVAAGRVDGGEQQQR